MQAMLTPPSCQQSMPALQLAICLTVYIMLTTLSAVQAMLDHTILPAAERLEGPYQQAFNRICNQVQQGCPCLRWAHAAGRRGLSAVLLCMHVLATVGSDTCDGANLSLRHVSTLIGRLGRGSAACSGYACEVRSLHAWSMTAGCTSTGCV